MKCQNCGADLENDSKFCTNCGATVNNNQQNLNNQQVLNNQPSFNNQQNNFNGTQLQTEPKKSKAPLIIGIVLGVVFLLIIIVVGLVFAFGFVSKSNTTNNKSKTTITDNNKNKTTNDDDNYDDDDDNTINGTTNNLFGTSSTTTTFGKYTLTVPNGFTATSLGDTPFIDNGKYMITYMEYSVTYDQAVSGKDNIIQSFESQGNKVSKFETKKIGGVDYVLMVVSINDMEAGYMIGNLKNETPIFVTIAPISNEKFNDSWFTTAGEFLATAK